MRYSAKIFILGIALIGFAIYVIWYAISKMIEADAYDRRQKAFEDFQMQEANDELERELSRFSDLLEKISKTTTKEDDKK